MPDTTIYAVGDIHGQVGLLRKLHAAILEDAAEHGVDTAEVVYLGDYIDRGPDSRGVIDELLNSPLPWPAVHLKGNHEDMMMDPMNFAETFLGNGGTETLASYGLDYREYRNAPAAALALHRALPDAHVDFFIGLKLFHRRGNWFFVHAGIDPRRGSLEAQREEALLWIRDPFLKHQGKFPEGVRVVHGHTIAKNVEIRKHRIGVDTGAVKHGRLSAVALQGDKIRVIQVT